MSIYVGKVINYGLEKFGSLPLLTDVGAPLFTSVVAGCISLKLAKNQPSVALRYGLVSVSAAFLSAFSFISIYQSWQSLYEDSYVFSSRIHCTKLDENRVRVEKLSCNEYECKAEEIKDLAGDCSQMSLFSFSPALQMVHRFWGSAYYHCNELECEKSPHHVELFSDIPE